MIIVYWPDGTWCHQGDQAQMTHMSDDYTQIVAPDAIDEDDIDAFVNNCIEHDGDGYGGTPES